CSCPGVGGENAEVGRGDVSCPKVLPRESVTARGRRVAPCVECVRPRVTPRVAILGEVLADCALGLPPSGNTDHKSAAQFFRRASRSWRSPVSDFPIHTYGNHW